MPAPELCPCLDSLFAGIPDQEALRRAAALGLTRFEFWDWRTRDLDALAQTASALGLEAVIFSGNTFHEPLVDPNAHERALAHFRRSLEVAQRLGTRLLVTHVGYALPRRRREEQWNAAVVALRECARLAEPYHVTLAVEPLNSVYDHPGYFLDSLDEAARLIEEVAHPQVRLLLDVYHMRVMHEDLLDRLVPVIEGTVHVHLADFPGRREPGSGDIPWRSVLRLLREGGYRGTLGLECWPTKSPEDALRRSLEILAG